MESYLSTSTDSKRNKLITSGKKVSAIQIVEGTVLKFIVMSTGVTVEDSPGDKFFLGLASNDPTQDKPALLTQQVTSNFIYLVKQQDLEEGDPDAKTNRGTPFKKSDIIEKHAALAAFIADDDADVPHVLVRECCSFPIPPQKIPTRGRASESTLSTLDAVWEVAQDPLEASRDPQALANDHVAELESGNSEAFRLVASPLQFGGAPNQPAPAPEAGQHTEEILQELGLDWDEIGKLKERGAIN